MRQTGSGAEIASQTSPQDCRTVHQRQKGSSLAPHFPLSFCLSFLLIQDAKLLLRQTPGAPPHHRQLPLVPDEGSLKSKHSKIVEGNFVHLIALCPGRGTPSAYHSAPPPSLRLLRFPPSGPPHWAAHLDLPAPAISQDASAGTAQGTRDYLLPSKGLAAGHGVVHSRRTRARHTSTPPTRTKVRSFTMSYKGQGPTMAASSASKTHKYACNAATCSSGTCLTLLSLKCSQAVPLRLLQYAV